MSQRCPSLCCMSMLAPGDPAPEFALPDADGRVVRLSDHRSRTVVVYFYPAALTPGCTVQAVDFTAALDEFTSAGIDVIGISPDTTAKLQRFRMRKQLRVTLLADPEHKAIDAYSVWGSKMIFGKRVDGLIRSTFVITVDDDGHGVVDEALYDVRATGHVDRLRKKLGLAAAV